MPVKVLTSPGLSAVGEGEAGTPPAEPVPARKGDAGHPPGLLPDRGGEGLAVHVEVGLDLGEQLGGEQSIEHEEAWLILAGFLLRPGFGAALDDFLAD